MIVKMKKPANRAVNTFGKDDYQPNQKRSEQIHFLGATPNAENVRKIADWLTETATDEIYATNNLPDICADAADCKEFAAGVLAMCLSRHQPHFVLRFRPEF